MALTEKGSNQEQAIVRCQVRDGQTEPWKEPPSVSFNRTYLNSKTNLKTTEGKTQQSTQEQRMHGFGQPMHGVQRKKARGRTNKVPKKYLKVL